MGNENVTAAPSGTFKTGDGLLNIAANKQAQFEAVCRVLGHSEWAAVVRFAGGFRLVAGLRFVGVRGLGLVPGRDRGAERASASRRTIVPPTSARTSTASSRPVRCPSGMDCRASRTGEATTAGTAAGAGASPFWDSGASVPELCGTAG